MCREMSRSHAIKCRQQGFFIFEMQIDGLERTCSKVTKRWRVQIEKQMSFEMNVIVQLTDSQLKMPIAFNWMRSFGDRNNYIGCNAQ